MKRIKGPYKIPPFDNSKVNPLGVVPNREPNSYRLIQGLSFGPQGSAVNYFIPTENATVTLETFDNVANPDLVLFVLCSICACLDLSVFSSFWGLGRAAVCDCGSH